MRGRADGIPLTAALVALILRVKCAPTLESALGRFLRHTGGDAPIDPVVMLERAFSAEPRDGDLTVYLLAFIVIEFDGQASKY